MDQSVARSSEQNTLNGGCRNNGLPGRSTDEPAEFGNRHRDRSVRIKLVEVISILDNSRERLRAVMQVGEREIRSGYSSSMMQRVDHCPANGTCDQSKREGCQRRIQETTDRQIAFRGLLNPVGDRRIQLSDTPQHDEAGDQIGDGDAEVAAVQVSHSWDSSS